MPTIVKNIVFVTFIYSFFKVNNVQSWEQHKVLTLKKKTEIHMKRLNRIG